MGGVRSFFSQLAKGGHRGGVLRVPLRCAGFGIQAIENRSGATQDSLRCRRNLYFKPVTKKQAAATIPKIKGAKRGNHVMGKIARITAAAWK